MIPVGSKLNQTCGGRSVSAVVFLGDGAREVDEKAGAEAGIEVKGVFYGSAGACS
jgi:hypothetical protein